VKTKSWLNIVEIPLELLVNDVRYQRPIRPAWVRWIATHWDNDEYDPVKVAKRRDGRYAVINGHHRVEAARLLGMSSLPAIVIEGLKLKQEAHLFVDDAKNRLRVSPRDIYKGELVEGKKVTRLIEKALADHNLCVAGMVIDDRRPWIVAIKRVRSIVDRHGESSLYLTLGLVDEIWGDDRRAFQGYFLVGFSNFLEAFLSPDRKLKDEDHKEIVKKLQAMGFVRVIQRAQNLSPASPSSPFTAKEARSGRKWRHVPMPNA